MCGFVYSVVCLDKILFEVFSYSIIRASGRLRERENERG